MKKILSVIGILVVLGILGGMLGNKEKPTSKKGSREKSGARGEENGRK